HPVSWFAGQVRQRRRLDTVWTLAGILRGLAGKSDPLRLEDRLAGVEDRLETGASPDPELAEVEKQVSEALAGRLLSGAAANRPGYLVLNPCNFIRRVALELPGITTPLPVEGPVKACQIDADQARLVLEVPALGFAWFPQA